MSYAAIEARVQSLLQARTDIFDRTADVSLSDERVLDAGSAPYAILWPGPFQEEHAGAQRVRTTWHVLVELFEKYTADDTAWNNLKATRENVVVELRKWPTLNGLAGVKRTQVVNGADILPVYDENDNGPFFLSQVVELEVDEYSSITGGEYA